MPAPGLSTVMRARPWATYPISAVAGCQCGSRMPWSSHPQRVHGDVLQDGPELLASEPRRSRRRGDRRDLRFDRELVRVHALAELVAVDVPVRLAHAARREQQAPDRQPLEDRKDRRIDAGGLQARLLAGQRDNVRGGFLHGATLYRESGENLPRRSFGCRRIARRARCFRAILP